MRCIIPRQPNGFRVMSSHQNSEQNQNSSRLHTLSPRPPKRGLMRRPNTQPYPMCKIALKFCYSGSEYSGLAYQDGPTPLPTVEGVLFNAMAQTFLVDRALGLQGCQWERCGRTDRGVSAAGQVVSLWVRTALGTHRNVDTYAIASESQPGRLQDDDDDDDVPVSDQVDAKANSHPSSDNLVFPDDLFDDGNERSATSSESNLLPLELPYISIINRILPPTIRVLAWSRVAPDFSARFACKYRHYKYFFRPHGLDISQMQDAARRLIGEHDFRNLCKLDPSKQITNFKRRILQAEISPVDILDQSRTLDSDEPLYVLDLIGTAFLYHQVRHIMAVIFLVGADLERPSVISSLLNVSADHPEMPRDGDPPLQVVDRKPDYQMADGLPLVLWDCHYADSDVRWRTDADSNKRSGFDLCCQLESNYTRSLIRSAIDSHFLAAAAQYHSSPPPPASFTDTTVSPTETRSDVAYIPLGGGTIRRAPKYVPLLSRNRLENVEVVNERWRLGKGLRKLEKQQMTADVGDDDDG